MGKGDINPGFTFFAEERGASASPWEVAGALKDARVDGLTGTSIDEKIRQRLADKDATKRREVSKPNGAPRRGGGTAGNAADRRRHQAVANDDASSDDEASDDEDDAPLPGEEDSDDAEDSEPLIDSDEDEEEAVGESDEEDEEDQEAGSSEEVSDADSTDEDEAEASSGGSDLMDAQHLDLRALRQQKAAPPAAANGAASPSTSSSDDDDGEQGQAGGGSRSSADDDSSSSSSSSSDDGDEQGGAAGRKRKRAPDGATTAAAAAAKAGGAGSASAKKRANKKAKGGGDFFAETPEGTQFVVGSFADLHLSRPLLKAVDALGYKHPTPIQAACIPLALTGRDICGSAMTGSGKTAAFGLPCLERLLHRSRRVQATYVLVLTPTRELAVQIHSMMQKLAAFTDVRLALVVGGLSLQAQAAALRSQPEVLVATPGRLIDHVRNSAAVGLEDLQVLVLDEADRLLEMGFAEEIREIVRLAPPRRQTMLFSATMTEEVRRLAALSLRQPVRLAADPTAQAPERLTQEIVRLKGAAAAHKEAVLLALASRSFKGSRTIVFCKTKARAHRAKILFGLAGLPPAGELHGDMTQAARLESLDAFRKGDIFFLLCTDVAARGLDILGVDAVLNYDAPPNLTGYLHRVGRTARAGEKGLAITIVEDGDRALIKEVVKKTRVQLRNRLVPQAVVRTWQARVEALQADIQRIREEEGQETALRKAEMEANKALNMVEHEAEIFSRPARTWFQTPKQKKEVADRAREEAIAEANGAGNAAARGAAGGKAAAAKTKAEKEAERNKRKAAEREAAAKGGGRKQQPDKLLEETKELSRNIRGAKAIEQQLRQQGMRPGAARKAAAAQVSTIKKKKSSDSKGKKRKLDAAAASGQGLFEGDGTGKPLSSSTRVYAGGAKSGKMELPKAGGGASKAEQARLKRGGKGRQSFKSKKKHKRR